MVAPPLQPRVVGLGLGLALACACTSEATPDESDTAGESSTESDTGTDPETETDPDAEMGTETDAEDTAADAVHVNWIEVAASDYKLELEPEFDGATTDYSALADGPGIEVYVDVNLDADVEGVTVNGEPAYLWGFRTWRSAETTGLVAPTTAIVEVLASPAEVPTYTIEILADDSG